MNSVVSAAGGAPQRPVRLNPFVLPSTTDSRFALLILAVAGATTFIYNWLALKLPDARVSLAQAALGCSAASRLAGTSLSAAVRGGPLADPSGALQSTQAYMNCIADFEVKAALWSLTGLPLLVVVASVLYWWIPRWLIRRRSLVVVDLGDGEDLVGGVSAMSREVGIKTTPTLLGAPGYRSTGALAFGHPGQRYVALDNGLVTQFYTAPDRFRAVVLHELAHLRNGDIDKAYLTVATTLAFAVVGMLPLLVSVIGQPLDVIGGLLVRAVCLMLLVVLVAAAVLRARELYADVRASTYPQAEAALRTLLDGAPSPAANAVQKLFRLHPAPAERRSILENTRGLFQTDLLEAFATGTAVALVLPRLISIGSGLATRQSLSILAPLGAALILAPIVVGILGLSIWRATFASITDSLVRPRFAPVALAFGGGSMLGELLSFDAFFELDFDVAGLLATVVLWGLLAALVMYGFVRWTADGIGAWLVPPTRRKLVAGLATSTLVLIAAFTLLFLVETTAKAANGNVSSGVLGSVVAFALSVGGAAYLVLFSVPLLTVPVLIALWAYPLAPFMWKRTRNPCSTDWMFLDEGTQTPSRLVVRPTGIWRAAASGVTAGVVFVLADVLITWQHYSQPVAARSAPDSVVAFFETLVGVAVLTQVVVAVFVALRSPALRVAHALFAAFVTGVAASASLIVVNIVFGGTVGGQFALTVYSQIVQVGALAACLAAALCHLRTSRASPTARLESPARKLAA